ncbi:MAG: aspartyl/glutamyl-tRNA amidotransferase subunit C [Spirochaetaceae bacterium]|jgi:Asp-tRNA(Asn)/Glu-tRNA(Gln) amidotransferase C subunit|nr:aspartyl/glutamyl-tRNA amidotransferase subunit C [Spirochaetaceae bacterium]
MASEKLGGTKPSVEIPIENLRMTASLAHLNVDEAELEAALPAFRGMLSYFAAMQAADCDEKAFGGRIDGLSFSGESVDSTQFRADAPAAAVPRENLTETMLDNSGERDSHFIVVPNVL